MADLPSYQSTGRVYSDLPQLDFANVRESFKQSQTMSNQLDRLSSYAFTEMGKATETKAAQFAVDNQLTIDQVREASKSGIKPEDLIKASGGGEIWQATISKIQGEQLRSQLEVLGKQALLDLQTQVDTNQIVDMTEVKAKQEAIVNGMRKTLSFAPDSVLRFDATMGSVTSALYKEAQDKLVKDYKIGEQSKSLVNLDNSVRAYEAMLNYEGVQDPAMLREIEYALADQLERQSAGGGAEFALKKKDEFVKRMQETKLNFFATVATSPEYSENMVSAVKRINAGDFADKTDLYKSLSIEEQKKVRDLSIATWTDLYSATEKQQKLDKIQNKEKDDADVISMFQMKDGKTKINAAQDLYKRDVITLDTLKGIISPKDEGDGDPLTKARAMSDVIFGNITSEKQLVSLYPNLNIKQRADLIEAIANKQVMRGQAKIRINAGASENPYAAIDLPTAGKIQIMNNLTDDFRAKKNPDGSAKYTYDEAVNEAIKQFPKEEIIVQNKSTQSNVVTTYFVKYFPDFNPDTMTAASYGKFKKLDENAINNLAKQHKKYMDAKKITGLSAGQL